MTDMAQLLISLSIVGLSVACINIIREHRALRRDVDRLSDMARWRRAEGDQ